jgi:uncharacterized protein
MTMTPQERELVTGLFDRLATLENQPRDADAERTIIEGLRRAPNAAYALVQTALVQDEALKRANAHIQELEGRAGGEPAGQPTGFLDSMRDALLGRREAPRGGSVPSVRPGQAPYQGQGPASAGTGFQNDPTLAPGAAFRQAPMTPPMAPGGSFLGTAASAAAGVIGGSLLLDGIRSMMGHGHGGFGMADPAFGAGRDSPWEHGGGGDLSRQAGIDDIGHDHQTGLFDNPSAADASDDQPDQDLAFDDNSGDSGGGDFGGGDFGGTDV